MASAVSSMVGGARISYSPSTVDGWTKRGSTKVLTNHRLPRVVRAEAINPAIRKEEPKVVDSVVVSELSKPQTAYCRCWRSAKFPLCDGTHLKHNKATGDNVGPLLVKK